MNIAGTEVVSHSQQEYVKKAAGVAISEPFIARKYFAEVPLSSA